MLLINPYRHADFFVRVNGKLRIVQKPYIPKEIQGEYRIILCFKFLCSMFFFQISTTVQWFIKRWS